MNKQKVFSLVLIFLLLSSVAFSEIDFGSTGRSKLTGLMFEIGPVYNMFTFDYNPIGDVNFSSTQLRAKIGLSSAVGEELLYSFGFSYMDSKQFFKQNDFNFYRVNLFFSFRIYLSKSSKFCYITDLGVGRYNIEYNGYSKDYSYVSISSGLGYNIFDNLVLIAGVEAPLFFDGDVLLSSGEETEILKWTMFFGFRYYLNLF